MRLYPERMEAFQDAQLSQAEAVMKLVGRPIMTVEEGRELLGMEEEPDGDLFVPPTRAGQPEEAPKALSFEASEELAKWRRKVEKNRDAAFECYHVPAEVQETVQDRLRVGFPLAAVFEPPYDTF